MWTFQHIQSKRPKNRSSRPFLTRSYSKINILIVFGFGKCFGACSSFGDVKFLFSKAMNFFQLNLTDGRTIRECIKSLIYAAFNRMHTVSVCEIRVA